MQFDTSELQDAIQKHLSGLRKGCSFEEIRSGAVARLGRKANVTHQARVALNKDLDFESRVRVALSLLVYEDKVTEDAHLIDLPGAEEGLILRYRCAL